MKDLVIIGAGPAGITAAVYAARQRLDFTVISQDIGGQAAWSGSIENYTGYQFITGPDLALKFREHLETFKFDLFEGEEVVRVDQVKTNFEVKGSKRTISCRALIVASGKRPKNLDIPGEKEFKNRGVTYCATCDGPLFAGKDVAVIGGGNSALDAALQLAKLARQVYVLNLDEKLGGDTLVRENVGKNPLIKVLNSVKITEIYGDKFVAGLKYRSGSISNDLPLSGIFIEIGLRPNTGFIDWVKKNQAGEIMVDCKAQTSKAGVFAAGDVTDVPEKQIIVAAGEGAKAALTAFHYLSKL